MPNELRRFIPDTPPESDDPREIIRWAMEQFERIHDDWPLSLQQRVEDLERLQSAIALLGTIEMPLSVTADISAWEEADSFDVCAASGAVVYDAGFVGAQFQHLVGWATALDSSLEYVTLLSGANLLRNKNLQVWSKASGSWALAQDTAPPVGMDYSEDILAIAQTGTQCVVGDSGYNSAGQGGAVAVYTGTAESGWIYNTRINPPVSRSNQQFGGGLGSTKDGSVLMVSCTASSAGAATRIYEYQWSGSAYVYQRELVYGAAVDADLPNDFNGFGRGLIAISDDGTKMIVPHNGHGVSNNSRCFYFERSSISEAFTKVSHFDLPNHSAEGITGDSLYLVGTPSITSLAVDPTFTKLMAFNAAWGSAAGSGGYYGFSYNPSSNEWEYCSAFPIGIDEGKRFARYPQAIFATGGVFMAVGEPADATYGSNSKGSVTIFKLDI